MKNFLVILTALVTLALPGQADNRPQSDHRHQHHGHQHQVVEVRPQFLPSAGYVARASTYVATCSQGDLNQRFNDRGEALKAARAHAQATGHRTGVVKQ